MIYHHKNPTIKTCILVLKIQYRDEKRLKFKGQILTDKGIPAWKVENYTVSPKFLYNFQIEVPKLIPDHEDLIKLDEEKENVWMV